MISLLIDAYKGIDVSTADVVGVYLMADINGTVIVKLTRESIKLICEVNAKYKQYIIIKMRKKYYIWSY